MNLICRTAGVERVDLSAPDCSYNEHASTVVEAAIGTLQVQPDVDVSDIEDMEVILDVLRMLDRERVVNSDGEIDYTEIDPKTVELCRAINEFPGIRTSSSCQGYIDGHRDGEPWRVSFGPIDFITNEGYHSIEFLVYFLNGRELPEGFDVAVTCSSAPPFLNRPGRTMTFCLEGRSGDPDKLAQLIREFREEHFFIDDGSDDLDDDGEHGEQ